MQRSVLLRCQQYVWEIIQCCHSDFCGTTKGTLHTLRGSFAIAFKDLTKNTKISRETKGTTEKIKILIKYSPKRGNILGSIKKQIEWQNNSDCCANNLLKLSEKRWTLFAVFFKRILDNCIVLQNVWMHCLQDKQ